MPITYDPKSFEVLNVLAYGTQITSGKMLMYRKESARFKVILLLCEGQGSGGGWCNGIKKIYYKGFPVTDYVFHRGSISSGLSDPYQGKPTYFPELGFTGSGSAWIEVWLDADRSTDDSPTNEDFKIIMECKRVMDYDQYGAEIGFVFSANPALIIMDIIRNHLQIGRIGTVRDMDAWKNRIDWVTWHGFKEFCDEDINWSGGVGGLIGKYYDEEDFTDLKTTRIDPNINFHWDEALPTIDITTTVGYSVDWSGRFKAQTSEVHTFYASFDDSCKLWVAGSNLIDDWATGAEREKSGSIYLTAGEEYDFHCQFRNVCADSVVRVMYSTPTIPKGIVPQENFVATTSETVKRFTADVAFPTSVSANEAIQTIFYLCPSCGWYEHHGKISFYYGSDRLPDDPHYFYYRKIHEQGSDKRANVGTDITILQRLKTDRPNFLRYNFRNKFDDMFREGRSFESRQTLIDEVGMNDGGGEVTLKVLHPSHIARLKSYDMRIRSDLYLFVEIPATFDSHYVHTGALVKLAHESMGYTEGDAPTFKVVERTYDSSTSTADTEKFLLQYWDPDTYSDDSVQNEISISPVTVFGDPFVAPEPITDRIVMEDQGTRRDTVLGNIVFDSPITDGTYAKMFVKFRQDESYFLAFPEKIYPDPETGQGAYEFDHGRQTMYAGQTFDSYIGGTMYTKFVTYNKFGVNKGLASSTEYTTVFSKSIEVTHLHRAVTTFNVNLTWRWQHLVVVKASYTLTLRQVGLTKVGLELDWNELGGE